MQTLTDIPFIPDLPALMAKNRLIPGSPYAAEFAQLLDKARHAARPKAAYKECYIQSRGPTTVTLDGVTFTSPALRSNLAQVERVFVYIATCGVELDEIPLPPGDLLQTYWWESFKTAALDAARTALTHHLRHQYALAKTAIMSPGSGDHDVWPIEQQHELFHLLGDLPRQIGVVLTGSYLMLPNKTVSGIRFPTEIDFHTCQLCHREECPSRAAPFDQALWDTTQTSPTP